MYISQTLQGQLLGFHNLLLLLKVSIESTYFISASIKFQITGS